MSTSPRAGRERTPRFICPSFIASCLLPEPSEFPSSPRPGLLGYAHTDAPAHTHTNQRRGKNQLQSNFQLTHFIHCFLKVSYSWSSAILLFAKRNQDRCCLILFLKESVQTMANTFRDWPRSTPQTWMVLHNPRASPPCSQRLHPSFHWPCTWVPCLPWEGLCKPCWVSVRVLRQPGDIQDTPQACKQLFFLLTVKPKS